MLTARGRRTITLGLIAGAAGRIVGIPELVGLATAAVVVALSALVTVRVSKVTVTVTSRAIPPVVNAGEPAVLELTIEASGVGRSLPTPVTLVTDHSQGGESHQPEKIVVRRLAGGDRAKATFGLPTERRGRVDAGAYETLIFDPLGLAWRRLSVSRPSRCIVLPRVEPLETVLPRMHGSVEVERTASAADRFATDNSLLRRYAQGDDLRRVHWRTTARVGELMVRDGGDRDDPDRITTTVVLHVGDDATRSDELDRAVEVAASILSAAADESRAAVSGAYRLVMADLDTGSQRGRDSLQNVLIALAGVAVASTASSPRLGALLEGLGQPDRDEALVIVGAFGKHLPEGEVLAELARAYSTVVLVAVGAASAPTAVGVLTVALPLGRSLAAAWSPDLEGQAPFDDVSGLEVRAAGVAR